MYIPTMSGGTMKAARGFLLRFSIILGLGALSIWFVAALISVANNRTDDLALCDQDCYPYVCRDYRRKTCDNTTYQARYVMEQRDNGLD